MKENLHIVAISGSLRKGSYNTMVLKDIQKLASEHIVIEQLSIADVPMYNFDFHEKIFPESIEKISMAIKSADALIIVTPEYNYSIPGVLKNVIDFLSKHPLKPIDKKAVGIISASPSLLGGVRAQFHLRQILVAANAMTMNIPEVVITQVNTKFDEEGNLTDEKTREFLKKFIHALAQFIGSSTQ
ncbi:MAG: NADPH-dependent FMN reductase [bacterium]|nr:NADPH-dependent FMN reductase [bacterium]